MTRLLVPFLFAYSLNTFATVTVTAVSGASNSSVPGTAGGAVTVYGGIAGPAASPCTDSSTCNTCKDLASGAFANACNEKQIGDNTPISFSFTSTYAASGTTSIAISNQTGTPLITGSYSGPGITQTIATTWGDLCNAVNGSSCDTSVSGAIKIGVVDNGTLLTSDSVVLTVKVLDETSMTVDDCSTASDGGICKYRIYAGDEVAYLEELKGDTGFPGNAKKVKVYVSNASFTNAHPCDGCATKTQEFDVSSDGSLSNTIIDGLDNDPTTPYHFRLAVMDAANNVYNFVSDANIQDPVYGNCVAAGDFPVAARASDCHYAATPDQVLGILTKDINCFIATAAYGSSLETKLDTFRSFRHRFLIPNQWGQKFVKSYYQWGPYAAQWISDREWARAATRALLWPLWGFSYLSLQWGVERALLATLMALVLAIASFISFSAWVRKLGASK